MIAVFETNDHGRRVSHGEFLTFADAKAYVAGLGVACMDDDEDYADCADAYTNDARLICIQPVGFKLADAKRGAKVAAFAKVRHDAAESLFAELGIKL